VRVSGPRTMPSHALLFSLSLLILHVYGQAELSWYKTNQTVNVLSMDQSLKTTGNCGIVNAYPAWVTTAGKRVVAPNSALPSYFNSPADPWSLIASGWSAGNGGVGTGGCFICLRLYASPTAEANAESTPRRYFPQPYLQAYVHDSESSGVLTVDDPAWYTNTAGLWHAVDCPVGDNKIYFQSESSQVAGFTKIWILGATISITAVSVSTDNKTFLATTQNTGDAAWIQSTIRWTTTSFPVTCYLKITSIKGETLYDSFKWTGVIESGGDSTLQPDQLAINGNVQFQGFNGSSIPTPPAPSGAAFVAPGCLWVASLVLAFFVGHT